MDFHNRTPRARARSGRSLGEGGFAIGFGAEPESSAANGCGVYTDIAELQRCDPGPQPGAVGLIDLRAGGQHFRGALDNDAPAFIE